MTVSINGSSGITFPSGLTQSDSAGFPSGTRMPFAQAAAPTGWTQDITDNADNRMLRVVKTAGGGVAGTSSPILNNVVPSHTHTFTTGNQSADHAHYFGAWSGGINANHYHSTPNGSSSTDGPYLDAGSGGVTSYVNTGYVSADHAHYTQGWTGGVNTNHTHSGSTDNGSSQTNWTPRYIDLIICSKD